MRKAILIPLFILLAAPAAAQEGAEGIITYKPKLIDAKKILIDPVVPKGDNAIFNLAYNPLDFQWNTRKISRILPPARHNEPEMDTSYNPNYARIGGGNYAHKLLELYIANRANKKWAYNMVFQHLSANEPNTARDFSLNKGYLQGARFFNRSSLGTRLNYTRDMNKYFAFDTGRRYELARNLSKIGQNIGANVLYDLKAMERKPGFKLEAMFNNYHNNLNQNETEYGLNTGFEFVIRDVRAGADIGGSNLKYRQNFSTTNQWFVDLMPRVKFLNKQTGVDANVGLNLTWVWKDKLKPVMYFNPFVYGEKGLEGLKMKMYGGIDGGLRRNSIRRFSEKVPFTYDSIFVQNTYEQLRLYAGLKGRITDNSQFSIEFGNSNFSDMPLYVSSGDSIGSLQILYDDVDLLYFAADLRFSIGEHWRMSGSGKFTDYGAKNELKAWGMPMGQYSVNLQYNHKRSWVFQAGVDGQGKRYNRVIDGPSNLEMKGFADVNLRVDYILKNAVRFWIQGSNLLAQEYQIWYGYNNYNLTILGGLSASF
jgi:hypothetical protein